MPTGVVDLLEAIEVTEEHGDEIVGSTGAVQRVLQPVNQQPTVGKTGERVMERAVFDLSFQDLALRDVDRDHEPGAFCLERDSGRDEVPGGAVEPIDLD